MVKTLKECMPESVKFTEPGGGFFCWLTLPKHPEYTAEKIRALCVAAGVDFIVGQKFFPSVEQQKEGTNFLRLAFSYESPENIEKGIRILSGVVKRAFMK